MSAVFAARYNGRCASCEERIREGDRVTYAGDHLVHADCDAAPVERPVVVCGSCHLTKPCDCEAS